MIKIKKLILNLRILSIFLFKKNLGSIADPIKNPINARASVIAKLFETEFNANIKNIEKTRRTTNGLKI